MRRSVVGAVCGPIGALVLGATAFTDGCALFDDEGQYEEPVGFTVQQTSRVAIAPGAFVRDGARVLTNPSVNRAARRADDADARPRLESEFFGTYADGMRVNASTNRQAFVDVLPEGAAAAPGRVRHDGAVLAFENAFPGVTSAFGADDHKVEEFLTIPSIEAVPSLAYTLRNGPDFGSWVEEEGKLWAFDKAGRGLFTLEPPVVDDAAGEKVTGAWKVTEIEGGVRITPELPWSTLQFPVLFDPTFETPTWFVANRPADPFARAGAASVFYPGTHNCSVLFGGLGSGAVMRNDVAVHCAGLWQFGAGGSGIVTNNPKPNPRAYAAAAFVPSPVLPTAGMYMFGGYSAIVGLERDLWRFEVNGTTTKTGTWTKVEPPVPMTAANWPHQRYFAGLGYTSAGLILFGGVGPQGHPFNDTWRYNGTTWTKVCDNCFRGRFGFSYAQMGTAASPEIVAFGGWNEATGTVTNTVQRFTGTTWEVVTIDPLPVGANQSGTGLGGDVEPPPRYLAWAARTANNSLLLGSGLKTSAACGGAAEFSDAWLWDRSGGGSRWQLVPTSPTLAQPGRREAGTAVFNSTTNEVLVFGGRTNCGSNTALVGGGRTFRGNTGASAALSVRCIDTGAPGGPNGNTCDKYLLRATVAGVTGDTSPSRFRAFFGRRRGATWGNAGSQALCGSAGTPIAPNAGAAAWECEVSAITVGAIDTGFTVRLRNSGYTTGGSLCGGANQPICNAGGFEASAACANDPFPTGNNTVVACTQ